MPMASQIGHTKWPCIIKSAILIWLVNLLAMPTKLPTYLLTEHIPTYLPTLYLPTYILLFIYLLSIYLHTYLYFI
jgi:hypothetical protein